MINLPKVKRCPCCSSINIVRADGINYKNNSKTLSKWILKKKIRCRKCKEEIGYFSKDSKQEKFIWLNELMCDDFYFDRLNKLKSMQTKLSKTIDDRYIKVSSEIKNIENLIRQEKIKLKIKFKIQKRSELNLTN